jgi:hypothetical protein
MRARTPPPPRSCSGAAVRPSPAAPLDGVSSWATPRRPMRTSAGSFSAKPRRSRVCLVWNPCSSRTPLAARSGPGAARRRSSTSRVVATSTAPIRWTRPSCSPTGLHRPRLHATGAARRPRDAEFVPVRVRPGRPGRRDNRDEPCPAVRRGVVRPAHAVGGGGTKQARVDARLCAREAPPAVAFREATLALRERLGDPRLWAPFVLVGHPRSSTSRRS